MDAASHPKNTPASAQRPQYLPAAWRRFGETILASMRVQPADVRQCFWACYKSQACPVDRRGMQNPASYSILSAARYTCSP